MGLDLEYTAGQTPLDEEEKDGLLISSISNRFELDEFEQQNIESAIQWSLKKKLDYSEILTEKFIKLLHKKMFGNIWKWAGQYRKSNKNIGVDKWRISVDLNQLLDDTKFWIENRIYEPDEIAVIFKHRLVSIHCFANGNGRHSRLIADIIVSKVFEKSVFTWANSDLNHESAIRKLYIECVRQADIGNIAPLMKFARM